MGGRTNEGGGQRAAAALESAAPSHGLGAPPWEALGVAMGEAGTEVERAQERRCTDQPSVAHAGEQ